MSQKSISDFISKVTFQQSPSTQISSAEEAISDLAVSVSSHLSKKEEIFAQKDWRRISNYDSKYTEKFKADSIQKSNKGIDNFFCKACDQNYKIQKMGEKIITDHINTTKHKKNLAEFNRSVPLTDFVKLKSASEEKRCLAAELTLAYHCARHNFSMNSANCSSELLINLEKNLQICYDAGLESFIFEVVTDKPIDLPHCSNRCREIVVPHAYKTKTGAKFKSRALQYCLEDEVNIVRDEDWIVHLDEETLLSSNSLNGILNFCEDGRHQFGQGVITYAQGDIVNWITTLSDSFRVADDMGKLRFQFKIFHKPLFGWKGSFVVTNAGAEKKVSFDHGPEGSIAEDCFFSMVAFRDGYSFDFIEGEMHEKSPFTFWDFLQQRRKWLQGIFLTVHSKYIPLRCKVLLASSLYAWVTMPLTTLQIFLSPFFPLPRSFLFDFLVVFVGAVNLYMYIFGVVKSFSHKYRNKPWKLLFYTLGAFIAIPFNVWIENLAVIMGMCSHKFEFYVVNKDVRVIVV